MTKHKIYVYGTLMEGKGESFQIPGRLYDLGWFPGAGLALEEENPPTFTAEVIEVDDTRLKELDHYEGYSPSNPIGSLYLRVPYLDGFIYEYNGIPPESSLISSGDWQAHKKEKKCA